MTYEMQSASLGNFARAVRKFQSLAVPIKADRRNDHLKANYVTFEAVMDVVNPLFQECGLSFVFTVIKEDELPVLRTLLMWSSDDGECQYVASHTPICAKSIITKEGKAVNSSMQDFGAALTYAKRITAKMFLGLQEDTSCVHERQQPVPERPFLSLDMFAINQEKWFAKARKQNFTGQQLIEALHETYRIMPYLEKEICLEYSLHIGGKTMSEKSDSDNVVSFLKRKVV